VTEWMTTAESPEPGRRGTHRALARPTTLDNGTALRHDYATGAANYHEEAAFELRSLNPAT
jgi:hypothetical protein